MDYFLKMRNIFRTVGVASAFVITTGAGMAFANVSVTGGNTTTGASSTNTNTHTVNDVSVASLTNTGSSVNALAGSVSTGGNALTNNTTVGGFMGGQVSVSGGLNSNVNSSPAATVIVPSADSVSATYSNGTTGASSSNTNSLDVNDTKVEAINNDATIANSLSLSATTGGNNVSNNTTVGPVSTGGVSATYNFDNNANQSSSVVVLPSAPSIVTASGTNGTTGFNSVNSNTTNVTDTSSLTENNTANVSNSFAITTDTGGNNVGNNTTVGAVSTGGVTLNLSATTNAN